MADVHCPMCGKPNPEELDSCQFCGARLKPLTGATPVDSQPIRAGEKPTKRPTSEFEKVKPADEGPIHAGEEPTRKNTGELERSLPSWLKSLRKGEEESQAESPADASPDLNLPAESQPTPSVESSAESLDWLAGLGSAAAEDEEEVPDWMAGLRGASAPGLEPEAPTPAEPEQAQPEQDWMSRLGGGAEQLPADSPEQTVESAPDWLSRLGQEAEKPQPAETVEAPAGEPQEEPAASEENLPDWLEALKSKSTVPEEPAPGSGSDLPDWLSGTPVAPAETDAAAAPVFSSEPAPARDVPTEVPDWLSQLQSDVKAASDAEEQAEEFEPAAGPFPVDKSGEPIPDWLSRVDQTTPPAASAPALVMSDEGESPVEPNQAAFSLETPDWLSKLRPDRSAETQVSPEEEAEPENLETADLPSWVQAMRPVESVISETGPSAPEDAGATEDSGPLAGLRGVLPSNPGLGAMRKPPAYAIKLQVSDNQQRYAAHLEKMVLEEGRARGLTPARLTSNRVWRWIISIILIAAVLLPLVSGRQFTPDMNLLPSEWSNTSTVLNEFPADAPILLVFDYDPALSGELEASAAPVIDHVLFLGARLALVSTAPTGPALAEQFLESTQPYHLETGLQYTNLGYLAGGPAGILSFATNPVAAARLTVDGDPAWETPALQGVSKLSDFAAVIILTDNADNGRIWIEQTRTFIGGTPLLMIISAQAEPMIRPYYDSGQIQGMVTGLVGGKTYEQSYAAPGLARRYWDSFGLGALAAEIMIAVGSVLGAIMAWRARKKTGEGV